MRESSKLPARRYVRASYAVVCLVVLAVFVLAMAGRMGALAEGAYSIPETHVSDIRRTDPAAAPPAPVALIVKQVDPSDALRINSEIPITGGPNPAAPPFSMGKASKGAREDALDCLTAAIYYEAARESPDGQRAVAQVVLNRVRHPAFPASVCGVVYQGSTRPTGCQFTFTCDGSLAREPDAEGWRRARKVAEDALSGQVYAPVGWATHYHADYVLPTWAASMAKNAVLGAHLFYRWAGSWGQPAAFTDAYAGREPNAAALRTAALAVPHVIPVYGQQGQVAEAIKEIPGAEAIQLAPSMRGDKRVAVRFNLAAREASKDVAPVDYEKKFEVSDNLKYALSSETVAASEQPLGKAPAPANGGGGAAQGSPER